MKWARWSRILWVKRTKGRDAKSKKIPDRNDSCAAIVAVVMMSYQKLHPGTPGSMKEIPVI
jgi:ribonuclease HI